MVDRNIEDKIWKFASSMKPYGIPSVNVLIFSLYLRYVLDNAIGVEQTEDYKLYTGFAKSMITPESSVSIDMLKTIIHKAASSFKKSELDEIPLGYKEEHIEKILTNSDLNDICDYILNESDNTSRTEKALDVFYSLIRGAGKRNGADQFSLPVSVLNLISSILNIKESDTFVDFTSGFGFSTLAILRNTNISYRLFEINREIVVLAEMLFLSLGYINGSVLEEDSLFEDKLMQDIADKIFIDPPIRITPEGVCSASIDGIPLRDSTISAVLRTCLALKEKGVAVIPVPGGSLVNTSMGGIEMREYLLRNKLLKAVITLPPCWSMTSIHTNLLVLSKEGNEEVLFIDISKEPAYVTRNGITEEGCSFILNVLNGADISNVPNLANKVPAKNVSAETLVPAAYLKLVSSIGYTKEEVDEKLSSLYAKLKEMI